MLSIFRVPTSSDTRKVAVVSLSAVLALASSLSTVLAHSYPQTMNPAPNARLDSAPAHVSITYDSDVAASGTSLVVLDSTGAPAPTQPDPPSGSRQSSVALASDLAPGPYTVAWTSASADDGHTAQGFYTFVVNGGPVRIIDGQAQAQAPAADLNATLTVAAAADGSSLLRVDLDNPAGVERVRVRLDGPNLGEDLLDTTPTGDGGWALNGNEVAVPGTWHAEVVVRRTNVFDDAKSEFDFSVDSVTGMPTFASAHASLSD